MAEPIGSLRAELSANYAQFVSDMGKARAGAAMHGKGISDEMRKVAASFDSSLKSAFNFRGMLGQLVAGASVTGFTMLIKNSIAAADKMYKLAQSTGLPVEQLSALSYAAQLTDVDLDSLAKSIGRLSKNMVAAAEGSGDASNAFSSLGIKVKNADGSLKSSGEVMGEIADKFKSYEDGAAKTALALAIFGRAGAAMIPMLNRGADGLREMEDEARKLGIVLSEDAGKAAEEFNDNLKRLDGVKRGLIGRIENELIPALTELSEWLLENAKAGDETGASHKRGSTAVLVFGSAAIYAVTAFKALRESLGIVTDYIKTAATTAWAGLGTLISGVAESMLKAAAGDFAGAKDALSGALSSFTATIAEGNERANEAARKGFEDIEFTLKAGKRDIQRLFDGEYFSNKTPPQDAAVEKKIAAPIIKAVETSKEALKNLQKEFAIIDKIQQNNYKRQDQLLTAARDAGLLTEEDYLQRKRALDIAYSEDEIARTAKFLNEEKKLFDNFIGKAPEKKEIGIAVEGTREKLGDLRKDQIQLFNIQTMQDAKRISDQIAIKQNYDQEIKAVKTLGETELKYAGATEDVRYRELLLAEQSIEMDKLSLQLKQEGKKTDKEQAEILDKLAEKQKAILALFDRQTALKQDWLTGLTRGVNEYYDEATNKFKAAEDFAVRSFRNMEDALTNFVMTGKMGWEDLTQAILKDLARIAIQQSITGPLAAGMGSMLKGLLPSFTYHQGGVVGDTSVPMRNVNPGIFANAPRLHSGLAGDEFPAILQKGETVIQKGGGAGVTVNIIDKTGADISTQSRQTQQGMEIDVMIDQAVAKKLGTFGSSSNKTLKQNFGAKERLTNR